MSQDPPPAGGPVPWGAVPPVAPMPPAPPVAQMPPAPPVAQMPPAPPVAPVPPAPGYPPPPAYPPPPVAPVPPPASAYPPAPVPPPPPYLPPAAPPGFPPPGLQQQPFPQPPAPQAQGPAQPSYFSPPPRRSGVGRPLLVGVAAVVAVAVVVAAVLLLRPEPKAPVTVLGVPDRIAYVGKVSDREIVATLDELRADEGYPQGSVAGVYADYTTYEQGDGTIAILVVAAHHSSDEAARRAWMSARETADRKELRGLVFQDVAPGPLGGAMRCSNVALRAMVCRFADAQAKGTIAFIQYSPGEVEDLHELARAVRSSVESRS